jgi:hypothetical protein
LASAIADVVAFPPTTQSVLNARQDIGGQIMMLCHQLEESWLEPEAERIVGPLNALAE